MFTLIDLPYKSLAPVISDQTLAFHHGKHLQTYVDNLNKLIAGTEFEGKSLEEIVVISSGAASSVTSSAVERSIFNNAGQILNHNLYFTQFKEISPRASLGRDDKIVISSEVEKSPSSFHGLSVESPLGQQIVKQWGSIDAFKTEFETKGIGLFGSGWVWLQANEAGELSIAQYTNADNPVCHFERSPKGEVEKSLRPLLTFDVWEHAYYLDYQNRRAAHLSALWQVVDWAEIERRYESV